MTATATRKRTQAAPEGLTEDEFDRLMDPRATGDPRASTYKRDRMLLEVLAGTGLRINEALTLDRSRVNLEKCSIRVTAARSKSGRARTVYFGPTLRDKLQRYLSEIPAAQFDLFVTRTGARMQDSHARRLFKKIARNAELDPERIHPHVLRHLYAMRYLSEGGTLDDLRVNLGHSSIRITQVYLDIASWHRAEAAARLDL